MHHIMFDIDGTLIESYDLDEECFISAVKEVSGLSINDDWGAYPFVTDRGILMHFIEHQAPHLDLQIFEKKVKASFLKNITEHPQRSTLKERRGATTLLARLDADPRYLVSIATGGWKESAVLKLNLAGFDIKNIPLASANDHHSRIEIMRIAKQRAERANDHECTPEDASFMTYVGDAQWDFDACERLGINFILVGNRLKHEQSIDHFEDTRFSSFLGWS